MKKLLFSFAIVVGLVSSAVAGNYPDYYDNYLDESYSRCKGTVKGSFLCDAVNALTTFSIRGVSMDSDPYARMIMCSSFALATKYERNDVYEGADVSLKYKSNGEIAWVILTYLSDSGKCGNIVRDIVNDKYVK